ncbi:MAG: hypothetical protein ACJAZV_001525 [Roseivirga sp.]|jgi:hypothetical protein
MINYLRKIRKKLADDNKPLKYFSYAFGEITLVVIGILIALSINNWNEIRKEEQQEIISYCKIGEDIESDKNRIETIIESIVKRQLVCKQLLLKLHSTPKDKSVILDDYLSAVRSNVFYHNKAAISDITSSGKLSLLHNEELKKIILEYYTEMENTLRIIHTNQSEVTDRIFQYDNILEMGAHQTFYREEYGKELMDLFPNINWQRDKNNPYFKKFEEHIAIAVVVNAREKQILENILSKIEPLLLSLNEACNR